MYEVKCPYCEHLNSVELEGDDNFDMECDYCNEEFEVIIECVPVLRPCKIEHKKCIDCGKQYRYTGTPYPKPRKYSDSKEYNVCNNCWHRETISDFLNP